MMGADSRLRFLSSITTFGTQRIIVWAMSILAAAAVVLNALAMARFKRGKLVLD
jgi:hypothetical protein